MAAVAPTVTHMAEIVLRVRLISGDRVDVTWVDPDAAEAEAVEHVIAHACGGLRCAPQQAR